MWSTLEFTLSHEIYSLLCLTAQAVNLISVCVQSTTPLMGMADCIRSYNIFSSETA